MSKKAYTRVTGRLRRKVRVRKKIFGTAERPRLNVFRSAKHIYVQVIDDVQGVTLAAASTLAGPVKDQLSGDKVARAKVVGQAVAAQCQSKNITKVVFDRNGYRYHGRIQAVAEGARESGLEF